MTPKALGISFLLLAVGLLGLFSWHTFGARTSRKQLDSPFQGDWEDAPAEEELLEPKGSSPTHRPIPDLRPEALAKRRLTKQEWDAWVARRNYPLTIVEGDTWEEMATKYLGDATLVHRLLEANPTIDPRRPLAPGKKLIIPFRYRR
jgi:hypothetical protein